MCSDFVIFLKIHIVLKINRSRGLRMFRLCHFERYKSFSKINRLQGLRGLRMFRLCHFFLKIHIIFKDK